jgi:hypothetical protein
MTAQAATADAGHVTAAILSHHTASTSPREQLVWEYDPPPYPGNSTGLGECAAAGQAADKSFAVGYECRLNSPVEGDYGLWLRIKEA